MLLSSIQGAMPHLTVVLAMPFLWHTAEGLEWKRNAYRDCIIFISYVAHLWWHEDSCDCVCTAQLIVRLRSGSWANHSRSTAKCGVCNSRVPSTSSRVPSTSIAAKNFVREGLVSDVVSHWRLSNSRNLIQIEERWFIDANIKQFHAN